MSTHYYEPTHSTLYRSRHGVILGVCRGIADYLNFSVFWTRIIAVVLMIFGYVFPVVAVYLIAALLMRPEPVLPLEDDGDSEFYNSYTSSRRMATQRLKRAFDNLDRRIQRMENVVTSREYNWEQRLNG